MARKSPRAAATRARAARSTKRPARTSAVRTTRRRAGGTDTGGRTRPRVQPQARLREPAGGAVALQPALAGIDTLASFLSTAGQLTLDDRRRIVRQALLLLEQTYVHLPHKRAMHAIDPVQRLRLLAQRLERQTAATMPGELTFHAELVSIFTSLRDLHTNYMLPAPFRGRMAFLPFLAEAFDPGTGRRYVVTKLLAGFTHPTFAPGVELTSWNGIPIARAVELNAERQAGSNLDARHARGLDALTLRPLTLSLPPDEEWVMVGYRTADGTARELRFDWQVFTPDPDDGRADPDGGNLAATAIGLDLWQDRVQQGKRVLFAPQVVEAKRSAVAGRRAAVRAADVATSMPDIFRATPVTTPSGTFGYLRIFSFNVDDDVAFVTECLRLIGELPDRGLILDVRDNGGGLIFASERLLQAFTPRQIEPEPVQFISTSLALRLCRLHAPSTTIADFDLAAWVPSLEQAIQTGAEYSLAFPITPRAGANDIGQRYHGPVVLITDARCYSATDIFAGGFQDHGIGPILGVDDNTGAGGANVWTHELLRIFFSRRMGNAFTPLPDSPFEPLPQGTAMRVSIRRTLRVGERSGTPVEDLGVVPDLRHRLTRNDLLNGNVDLINAAGAILAALPSRKLTAVAVATSGGSVRLRCETRGLDRLDLYRNGRPLQSIDVTDGTRQVPLNGPNAGAAIEVRGFTGGTHVATRRLQL
jgi:C-terminal processing protease CtpA/Prc